MAQTLQHDPTALGAWLPASGACHHRSTTANTRRTTKHAIVSHSSWYKISVRPLALPFSVTCLPICKSKSDLISWGIVETTDRGFFGDFGILGLQFRRCKDGQRLRLSDIRSAYSVCQAAQSTRAGRYIGRSTTLAVIGNAGQLRRIAVPYWSTSTCPNTHGGGPLHSGPTWQWWARSGSELPRSGIHAAAWRRAAVQLNTAPAGCCLKPLAQIQSMLPVLLISNS